MLNKLAYFIFVVIVFSGINFADAATPFFAEGKFTENGLDWCDEEKPRYDLMGEQWFEHHKHSIEARICANLYTEPIWDSTDPNRAEKLIERSSYYFELETSESIEEAEVGVIDTMPVDIPEEPSQDFDIEEEHILEMEQRTPPRPTQPVDQESIDAAKQIVEVKPESQQGGGCLIATAAFGSELAPQVQMLREIRDNTVLSTASGTAFMIGFNQLYYSFSPAIADLERQSPQFKEAVKLSITPMLSTLSILSVVDIDSEQEMLGYGIGVILLNIGMYVGIPLSIVITIKNKIKK